MIHISRAASRLRIGLGTYAEDLCHRGGSYPYVGGAGSLYTGARRSGDRKARSDTGLNKGG